MNTATSATLAPHIHNLKVTFQFKVIRDHKEKPNPQNNHTLSRITTTTKKNLPTCKETHNVNLFHSTTNTLNNATEDEGKRITYLKRALKASIFINRTSTTFNRTRMCWESFVVHNSETQKRYSEKPRNPSLRSSFFSANPLRPSFFFPFLVLFTMINPPLSHRSSFSSTNPKLFAFFSFFFFFNRTSLLGFSNV